MRKFHSVLLLLIVIPFISQAQEFDKPSYKYGVGNFFIGLNAGADYNFNAYKSKWSEKDKLYSHGYKNYEFEGLPARWNMGVDLGYMLTEKLRPRFEVKYVRMATRANWIASKGWEDWEYHINDRGEIEVDTDGKAAKDILYTTIRLKYLDFNVFVDYLLFGENNRFKFFVSPGLKWEINMGASYKSESFDKAKIRKVLDADLDNYYPHSAAAIAVAGIGKYDVSELIGITFRPEYTLFLRKFQKTNDDMFHRLSFNVGVEIRIK